MSLRRISIGVLFLAAMGLAADVDGQWTGTFVTPNGDRPVTFTLKAEGDKLTGTTTGPAGEVQISNGKVEGDNISFSVTFDSGGVPVTMNYRGVVANDEIKFTIDSGMPVELTVKKTS